MEEAIKLGKMLLVKLNNEQNKMRIIQKKSEVKGIKGEQIYINDLTETEREIDKMIQVKAKEEKAKGKQVRRAYKRLIIDGVEWKWNEKEKKLEVPSQPKN